ncbi:hypothetical protein DAEQUDRAFT_728421 [Daedalea quercina L-15889]|uniref:Uncharacterized protein n=1 Tax=Daedalea quercina L-15889 TaxID=1314783 RepID=A0A165P9C2_9APHY|nr:hypothetical protein DAEQUDRAFT_728421 [Daedalea quercina L-15889]
MSLWYPFFDQQVLPPLVKDYVSSRSSGKGNATGACMTRTNFHSGCHLCPAVTAWDQLARNIFRSMRMPASVQQSCRGVLKATYERASKNASHYVKWQPNPNSRTLGHTN